VGSGEGPDWWDGGWSWRGLQASITASEEEVGHLLRKIKIEYQKPSERALHGKARA